MLYLLLSLTALALPPSDTTDVHIVYTGASRGIGSGRYELTLHERIAPHTLSATQGVLVHDRWMIEAHDGRVQTLLDLFDDVGPVCSEPLPARRVDTDREVLVVPEDAPLPEDLAASSGSTWIRRCHASSTPETTAWLYGPADVEPPSWDLRTYEFRLGLQGTLDDTGTPFLLVGRPWMEASRRASVLEATRNAHPGSLFVDAGSFVDGVSSVRDNALSLHRPLGYSLLSSLRPSALVPGDTELAPGPEVFLVEASEHRLPYVATNWQTELEALTLPPYRIVQVPTSTGESTTIAFLGLIDPELARWNPKLVDASVRLVDPIDRANEVTAQLHALPTPPDHVIALTTIHGDALQQLADELVGVDLILGGPHSDRVTLTSSHHRVEKHRDPSEPPIAVLPSFPVATARLTSVRHDGVAELSEIVLTPVPVPLDTPPSPEILAAITTTRATEYPPLDRPLLRPPDNDPTASLSPEQWAKIACEAVSEYTRADLVILPPLPEGTDIPGPLTELMVVDRLAMLDRVELHRIPGDRMEHFLAKAHGLGLPTCGAPLGARFPKARGRSIEAARQYRVVTTDRARLTSSLDALLSESYSPRLFDRPQYLPLTDETGAPRTLRQVVLDGLRARRGDAPAVSADDLLTRSSTDRTPQWLFRLDRLALRIERFQGADDPAFQGIPETRATSPSSLTLGGDLDTALDFSSRKIRYDLRLQSTYTRLAIHGEDARETADDLRPSTSLTLPLASIPTGKHLAWMPYGEVFLDSELTPVSIDGQPIPRQLDLYLTLGLSATRSGPLRVLRIGGFTLRDLSVVGKPSELGLRLEAETRFLFGPGLVWHTKADATWYAYAPGGDETDLLYRALLDTRLSLPLARYLSTSIYGEGFVFGGRVPDTQHLGASWTLGFSIDVSGAFLL